MTIWPKTRPISTRAATISRKRWVDDRRLGISSDSSILEWHRLLADEWLFIMYPFVGFGNSSHWSWIRRETRRARALEDVGLVMRLASEDGMRKGSRKGIHRRTLSSDMRGGDIFDKLIVHSIASDPRGAIRPRNAGQELLLSVTGVVGKCNP